MNNFTGIRFESWLKQLFFSLNFLLGGYFCTSKCPGPAVANFELMIKSLMMNRVKKNLDVLALPSILAKMINMYVGEAQSERRAARKAKWNETRAKLINAVNIASVEAALEDEIAELIALGHGEGFDPNWDLVNSLYYCSSLYTTVGKVAFSIGSP